jgi:hypothetical protein
MPSKPERIPDPSAGELKRARQQLSETVSLLKEIVAGIAATDLETALLRYLKRLGLATLVDLAISFSPTPPSATQRSGILAEILGGRFQVGIGDPLLLWFAPGVSARRRAHA